MKHKFMWQKGSNKLDPKNKKMERIKSALQYMHNLDDELYALFLEGVNEENEYRMFRAKIEENNEK